MAGVIPRAHNGSGMQASQTDVGVIVDDAVGAASESQAEPLGSVSDANKDGPAVSSSEPQSNGVTHHEAGGSPFYDMGALERITGIVGVALLVVGLAVWKFRPGATEHRAALLMLVCAMFLAILHYYTLEDTRRGAKR